jgi:arylsulfatase A-like enzyme
MDLLPTFAVLAGASAPSDRIIDGKDISPLLLGKPGATSPHEAFYYYFKERLECVRSGKWKLRVAQVRRGQGGKKPTKFEPQLFDLENDLGETRDVAARHAGVVARLQKLAERAREDLGDGANAGRNQRRPGHVKDARPLTRPDGRSR